jgi:hypothetical protein
VSESEIVPLHRLAHARSGDKGNRVNIAVIVYRPTDYPLIVEQVTEDRVATLLRHRGCGRVTRFELPRLGALNFVIDDALEGGVNGSLGLDGHGKCLSFLLLTLPVKRSPG